MIVTIVLLWLAWFVLVSSQDTAASNVRTGRRSTSSTHEDLKCHIKLSGENNNLMVDGEPWLKLAKRYCIRKDGKEICEASSTVKATRGGSDELGQFSEHALHYDSFEVATREYLQDSSTLLFHQTFLESLNGTNYPANTTNEAAENGVSSWFPAFEIPTKSSSSETPDLGFFELNGLFIGAFGYKISTLQDIRQNNAMTSGPVAIFSDECVLIMSTASSFMTTSSLYREDLGQLGYGVLGSITSIPKNHQTSVILSSHPRKGNGPDGIRQAFTSWGAKLQKLYHTRRLRDVTLDYLQYSTDNGAYYYYHTEENQTYQDTLLDLKEYSDKVGLPFRSWLMDSWWYYKGKDAGVKEWVAMPSVFPDGLSNMYDKTNWMIMAHNRFWSPETIYAKQNGGKFDFVIDGHALPLKEEFWDYFFGEAKKWGLDVYEQDWMNWQTRDMNYTLQNIGVARRWLVQMGNAAKRRGIPIQYCMSWPSHLLQSLEIDAVTQIRASDDVTPDSGNSLQLGVTSMFAHALGVTPHKDSFWSTPIDQPRNPYKYYEEASVLLSVIATYSTGPVAPSDKKEYLNVDLIMRSCSQDGTLLKPDIPAVRTDSTFLAEAGIPGIDSQQRNQTWSTKTTLSGYTWTYILSAGAPEFHLYEADVYPSEGPTNGFIACNLNTLTGNEGLFLQDNSFVPASNETHPQVVVVAPVFPNGWTFLGEAKTKWTPVSTQRFSRLEVTFSGFSVQLTGSPGENVEIMLVDRQQKVYEVMCKLGSTGRALFDTASMACHETNPQLNQRNSGPQIAFG